METSSRSSIEALTRTSAVLPSIVTRSASATTLVVLPLIVELLKLCESGGAASSTSAWPSVSSASTTAFLTRPMSSVAPRNARLSSAKKLSSEKSGFESAPNDSSRSSKSRRGERNRSSSSPRRASARASSSSRCVPPNGWRSRSRNFCMGDARRAWSSSALSSAFSRRSRSSSDAVASGSVDANRGLRRTAAAARAWFESVPTPAGSVKP
mmetsp:Transcript_21979/g.87240  ORF Transcript_21979/g.87240 Transcript_21979/m.87240 type:complete len:211 (-) Transcript_21979:165-797(-)